MMVLRWLITVPDTLSLESSHEGSINMSLFSESPLCSVCTLGQLGLISAVDFGVSTRAARCRYLILNQHSCSSDFFDV